MLSSPVGPGPLERLLAGPLKAGEDAEVCDPAISGGHRPGGGACRTLAGPAARPTCRYRRNGGRPDAGSIRLRLAHAGMVGGCVPTGLTALTQRAFPARPCALHVLRWRPDGRPQDRSATERR